MRIASVHSAFSERGGAEQSVLEQAHFLARSHDLTVFTTYTKARACYPDLMRGLDIRQLVGVAIPKFDLLVNTSLGTCFAETFRRHFRHYDVLLSHQQPAHWVAYCSKQPYVVQIRSLLTILYPDLLGDTFAWDTDYDRIVINLAVNVGGRRFLRLLDQTAIRVASEVLVHGTMLGKIVRQVYGVRPIQVPYGMDFSRYVHTDPASTFARYSITRPLILMVTRALPSKRPDVMIRILPSILKDHPTATLVIACAKGPYTFVWRRLAERLGVASSTRILSVSTREIYALYTGASAVGYPTQAPEALGRVVIEAMYFGVPPIVWDNGWGPAEVVKDGVGFRARPYDIDDFRDKVLALLNDSDLRQRMATQARHYAVKTYSWQSAGPPLEEILERVATNK